MIHRRMAKSAALAALLALADTAFAQDESCADLDESGVLTSTDALLALREAVGLATGIDCGVPSRPLRTGQTTCSNAAGTSISCTGTRQDGDLKRGISRTFTDNGDGTISDTATGLMWEKFSDDGTNHDWDLAYTHVQAYSLKIAQLNSFAFAGYNDWRLPNRFELDTLVSLGASEPATPAAFNSGCQPGCTVQTCSCTPSECFWSSTTDHSPPEYAWLVKFGQGYSDSGTKLVVTCRVRGVRGGT